MVPRIGAPQSMRTYLVAMLTNHVFPWLHILGAAQVRAYDDRA